MLDSFSGRLHRVKEFYGTLNLNQSTGLKMAEKNRIILRNPCEALPASNTTAQSYDPQKASSSLPYQRYERKMFAQ